MKDATFLLALVVASKTYACLFWKHEYCRCDAKRKLVSCSHLQDSVDTILPGLIPRETRILSMRRMWVDDAVELNPRNLVTLRLLKTVDFSYNRISNIRPGTFRNMGSLIWVNLSHNRLRLLDAEAFSGAFPNLQTLDLSNNGILLLVDFNFKGMINLRFLDLRQNPILFISGQAFQALEKLERLYLSSANFTQFPAEPLRELSHLKELEMTKMYLLKSIPNDAFSFNKELESLTLRKFTLRAEGLHDGAFGSLENLRSLTLASCNLTVVPFASMAFLKRLENLDLSGNPLKTIYPMDFKAVKSLKRLSLESTALKEIKPEAFLELERLISLDLSNNRLKTLYKDVFPANISTLVEIRMTNNAWSCDCGLKWLATTTLQLGSEPVTCANPNVMGESLIKLLHPPLGDVFHGCLPPKAETTPTITATEGGVATLPCKSAGNPPLTFTWSKAGTRSVLRNEESDGSLTIRNVRTEDEGEYRCDVRNAGGLDFTTVRLSVRPNKGLNKPANEIDLEEKEDCSSGTSKIAIASSRGPSGKWPENGVTKSPNSTTTVLLSILGPVTSIGVVGVFVFMGCFWNRRRERDLASVNTAAGGKVHANSNGTRGRPRLLANEARSADKVILGGQGIYSKRLDELDAASPLCKSLEAKTPKSGTGL